MSAEKRIRRALLSVTDKTGLVDLAQVLAGFGVELVSTGGTARALREAGLAVKDISDLTGFPEMLDGRVKTLHPKVHGGLLYIRGNHEHEAAVAAHGIQPIDMVVVNLYAFEKTAAQPGVAFGHLIENIDIGGPSMVRSAAKNFEDVAIVTRVVGLPGSHPGTESHRRRLEPRNPLAAGPAGLCAHRRLRHGHRQHARPDCARAPLRPRLRCSRHRCSSHDPAHQLAPGPDRCATAKTPTSAPPSTPTAPASASPAHTSSRARNSASTTSSISTPAGSWRRSSTSPWSSSSSTPTPAARPPAQPSSRPTRKRSPAIPSPPSAAVIGINRPVDAEAAEEIAKLFVEAIAAPSFTPEARERFAAKKNLRLVEVHSAPPRPVVKHVSGGLLLQDADTGTRSPKAS